MCKCIEQLESRIITHYPTYNKKKVIKVQIDGIYNISNGFSKETTTKFYLIIENQKKEIPIKIVHTFCPFCGIKKQIETNDSN